MDACEFDDLITWFWFHTIEVAIYASCGCQSGSSVRMMTTMLVPLIENVIKCFVRRRRRSRLINSPAREGRRLEGGREAGARLTCPPTNTPRC